MANENDATLHSLGSGLLSDDPRPILEALRCGVVPPFAIEDWTFGRDNEKDQIFKWLKNEGSATMVLEGAYGSGKSHMLRFLYEKALADGYLVSFVGLNPLETPPSFPKRVYRGIVRNLRYSTQGHTGDFKEFLISLSHRLSEIKETHHMLSPILELISEDKMGSNLWSYIYGEQVTRKGFANLLPSLPDHTTAANVYCYLLSGIAYYAANYMGFKGLLILMDEMELSKSTRYQYEWKRGLNFLDGLSKTAFDEEGLHDEKVIKVHNVHRGDSSNLIYSAYTPVPYAFEMPSFMKLVVGITPEFIDQFGSFMYNDKLILNNLKRDSLQKFLERTITAYKDKYNIWLSGQERIWIYKYIYENFEYSTRLSVKACIECLDFKRYNPKKSLLELEQDAGLTF